MDTEHGWLALSLVPGVGARTFHRLIQRFGSPEQVFTAPRDHLGQVAGLKQSTVEAIMSFPFETAAKEERVRLRDLGVGIIRWGTEQYPSLLANIHDPPPLLYLRGTISPEDEMAVAVVGSRNATPYGLTVCKRLCEELALQGWTVVSGMARGIDSVAHLGALEGGGRTIAVLGTGLDVIYPAENKKLYQRTVASGAVVTEFPLGTPPEPGNFPIRNRIISGLALGVVVVEATAKSGSLITARMALDQGRQVFAVPGPIDRRGVAGPHRLIKEGAKLVERPEDIVEELLPMVSHRPPAAAPPREGTQLDVQSKLDDTEQKVWDVLSLEPLHMDVVARQLDFSVSRTSELLLRLEIRGLVKQLPGIFFVRAY